MAADRESATDGDRLSAALRRALAATEADATDHPSAEALLAYNEGRLAPAAREALLDHLADCSLCSRTVLDLARFPDIDARAPDPTDGVDLDREIDAIRRRLREDDQADGATTAGDTVD